MPAIPDGGPVLSTQPGAVLLDLVDHGAGIAAAGGTRLLGKLQFLALPGGHTVRIKLPQQG
jgi:hypothetical protein